MPRRVAHVNDRHIEPGIARVSAQVHVRHRDGHDLTAALRAAEAAVKNEMGYRIALLEKPLYVHAGAGEPSDQEIDAMMDQWDAQQQ
tara:strand:+ start:1184 stop:1444 length:261 start_codon:yes stop_codon:yes gene_type:complete